MCNSYRDYVQELFREKSSDKIGNDKIENAIVLYEAIFMYAQEKVRIFCNNMDARVFSNDSVCTALHGALNRGVKLDIIVKTTPEKSKALPILVANKDKVRMFRGGNFTSEDKPVNFVVMDSCGYRYEYNSANPCAVACANDPTFASQLKQAFDSALPVAS